jgi:hypothetical protein
MINTVALDNLLKTAQTTEDWDIVWQTCKARSNQFQASLANKWHVGQQIQFYIDSGRNRGNWYGEITKLKTSAAEIKTSSGIIWTINYSYLKDKT